MRTTSDIYNQTQTTKPPARQPQAPPTTYDDDYHRRQAAQRAKAKAEEDRKAREAAQQATVNRRIAEQLAAKKAEEDARRREAALAAERKLTTQDLYPPDPPPPIDPNLPEDLQPYDDLTQSTIPTVTPLPPSPVDTTDDTTVTPVTQATVEPDEPAIAWQDMPDLQPTLDLAKQEANIAKDQARKNGDKYMWDLKSLLYVPTGETEIHEYISGYKDNGDPIYEKVVRQIYSDELTEIERPDFGEYGPTTPDNTGPLGGLYDAIQRLQAGPDTQAAFSHAATLMGFENNADGTAEEQYRSWIEEGRNTALEDMEGLSKEEEDRMERLIYSGYTADRDTANRQVENMYSQTGSYMRALQMSDEAARSIRDSRLQGEVMMMNQDFERKLMQFEAKKDQFFPLFQEGQASAQDFLANSSRMMQLEVQAYTQAVGMMQLEYENEVGALQQSIENITKAAMLSIGFDEHAYNSWMAEYSTTVQPALDAFQAWLSAEQLRMGQQALDDASQPSSADNAAGWGSVFQGIAAALSAVNAIFNPAGAVASIGGLILGGLLGDK